MNGTNLLIIIVVDGEHVIWVAIIVGASAVWFLKEERFLAGDVELVEKLGCEVGRPGVGGGVEAGSGERRLRLKLDTRLAGRQGDCWQVWSAGADVGS